MYRWSIASSVEKPACYALRAAEYARYYRNIPAEEFVDEFDTATTSSGTPVGYVISVMNESVQAGTVRLVLARHPQHPELKSEVAELMEFEWDSIARNVGVPPNELMVGELGKFAVAQQGDTRKAKWLAATAAGAVAVRLGLNAVVAIMPRVVERSVRHSGIGFHRLEETQLRRDRSRLNRMMLRYHEYFLPDLERSGLDVDADYLDEAPSVALPMVMAGSDDGPVMWWITPEEMANAPYPGSSAENES